MATTSNIEWTEMTWNPVTAMPRGWQNAYQGSACRGDSGEAERSSPIQSRACRASYRDLLHTLRTPGKQDTTEMPGAARSPYHALGTAQMAVRSRVSRIDVLAVDNWAMRLLGAFSRKIFSQCSVAIHDRWLRR